MDFFHNVYDTCLLRGLSCETYFVLPAGVAEPQEIPEAFGVWLLNGPIDAGTL